MKHLNNDDGRRSGAWRRISMLTILAVGCALMWSTSTFAADQEVYNPGTPRTVKQIQAVLPMHDAARTVTVEVVGGKRC